jgi:hypothetical protein
MQYRHTQEEAPHMADKAKKATFTAKPKKAKKPKRGKSGRGHGNAWKAYVSPTSNTPIPW